MRASNTESRIFSLSTRSFHDSDTCSVQSFECYCARDLPQLPISAPSPTPTPQPFLMTTFSSSSNTKPALLAPTSAPAAKRLKRQRSDLSKWIIREGNGLKSRVKSRLPAPVPSASARVGAITKPSNPPQPPAVVPKKFPSCGGRVHIMSIDDESHRLGRQCLGQRVVIVIDHGRQM